MVYRSCPTSSVASYNDNWGGAAQGFFHPWCPPIPILRLCLCNKDLRAFTQLRTYGMSPIGDHPCVALQKVVLAGRDQMRL